MKPMLKLSTLSAAVLSASTAMAGGFDNSDRSLDILFGDNNVITTSYGQTSVPMGGTIEKGAGSNVTIQSGDVVGNFVRPEVAFRYNLTEDVTCATKYEQPFAATVDYGSDGVTYDSTLTTPTGTHGITVTAPAMTKYESESITVACGYDLALSTGKMTFVAGPKIQEVSGGFTEDLSSANAGALDDLSVNLDGGAEAGYVLGAAYSLPLSLHIRGVWRCRLDKMADD